MTGAGSAASKPSVLEHEKAVCYQVARPRVSVSPGFDPRSADQKKRRLAPSASYECRVVLSRRSLPAYIDADSRCAELNAWPTMVVIDGRNNGRPCRDRTSRGGHPCRSSGF